MHQTIIEHIIALESMKKYPENIFYKGDLRLLKRPKVSIVGSRRLSTYTREFTYKLAKELSLRGVCVVSGAAMGVDAIAHEGAGSDSTIAVVANGLDIRYPAVNKNLIEEIEENGLVLSQFKDAFRATGWSFVVRNELVVALGDILIVTEADLDSGSMRSVEYALKMDKQIYVLPHRLTESLGTQKLLDEGKAIAITNIDSFVSHFGKRAENHVVKDDFFYFCQLSPSFDATVSKFGDRVYEAELDGLITVHNGTVRLN
ncbi:MAG: DNA-protecting protein DprA [Sulfurovum sp.]|nr:DNA-protecting protein DprA [Sulfurovum sp.]